MTLKSISYLLPKLGDQLTKSADFWLSKSIFYVKNYPNLFHFFFQFRSMLFVIVCERTSYEVSKKVVYIYRYPHIPWWYRHDWLLATHSITISTQKTKWKVHSQKNMYNFSKRKISQFNFGFRVDAEDFRQKNWVIHQSRKYFVWDSCTKWNVRFNIGCWHSICMDSKTLAIFTFGTF